MSSEKTIGIGDDKYAKAMVQVDDDGFVLTPGRVMDSTRAYSFDLSSLPYVPTFDAAGKIATETYGPDLNGRSVRQTTTRVNGVITAVSAWVLV